MRRNIRAVLFGIFLGAAAFFIPFVFRFILIAIVIGFIIRLIFGYRWRRGFYRNGYCDGRYEFSRWDTDTELLPIDGNRYFSSIQKEGGERVFVVD